MKFAKTVRALAAGAVAIVVTAATPAPARVPGMTFDMTVTTTMEPQMPGGAGAMSMSWRGMVNNAGASRMDIGALTGAGLPYVVGDYMLQMDGHSYLVHPASKTYVDAVDQALVAMSNLPAELMSQMQVTGVAGSTEKVPGSEVIEGRATEHFRSTMSYTMSLMGQTIPSTITTEYWAAKLPLKLTNPMMGGNAMTQIPAALSSGPMGEMIKKQRDLLPTFGDAVPVRMTVNSAVSVQGQSVVTKMMSEMKNIKTSDVDAAMFTLPAGFTKADK